MSTLDILSADERFVVETVRDFVTKEVKPVVQEFDHTNTYPEALIEQMKRPGISVWPAPRWRRHARVHALLGRSEELASGWMSQAGAMDGPRGLHAADPFGPRSRSAAPPAQATGGMGHLGRPPRRRSRAPGHAHRRPQGRRGVCRQRRQDLDHQLPALLADRRAVQDGPGGRPAHQGISILLVEHGPGVTVSRGLPKLGYKAVESCGVGFVDYRTPADSVLGGVEGQGFAQMTKGLGRPAACTSPRGPAAWAGGPGGLARLCPGRESFGKPIWSHEAFGGDLADRPPARRPAATRRGERGRGRAPGGHGGRHGQAVRLRDRHGDRPQRRAHPRGLRLLDRVRRRTLLPRRASGDRGEGTNEIQRTVIAGQLVKRGGLDA
ncbi:acyl-CoA dehydrogenase family protein [Streptomyces hirsutus]